MNQGVIAARYAKALLKYVLETGNGDIVYSQACMLVDKMYEVPKLEDYVCRHPEVVAVQKTELLAAALEEPLADELKRFVLLIYGHGRMDFFARMLLSYIDQYRREKGIKVGRLVSAVHLEGLKERMEKAIHLDTGAEVHLEEELRPDLIGGFVLEIDGMRLDASVQEQLRGIRRGLIDDGSRIV